MLFISLPSLIFASPNSRYKIPNRHSFWPQVSNLEGEPTVSVTVIRVPQNNQPGNLRGMEQNVFIAYSPRIQRSWEASESYLQRMDLPTCIAGAKLRSSPLHHTRLFNTDRRAEILPKTHNPNNNGMNVLRSTLHLWAFPSSKPRPRFMPGWGHLDATNEPLKTQEVDHLVSIWKRLRSASHVRF